MDNKITCQIPYIALHKSTNKGELILTTLTGVGLTKIVWDPSSIVKMESNLFSYIFTSSSATHYIELETKINEFSNTTSNGYPGSWKHSQIESSNLLKVVKVENHPGFIQTSADSKYDALTRIAAYNLSATLITSDKGLFADAYKKAIDCGYLFHIEKIQKLLAIGWELYKQNFILDLSRKGFKKINLI